MKMKSMGFGFNEAAATSPRKPFSMFVFIRNSKCFNEAAATSPRKPGDDDWLLKLHRKRFNEAAATSPRKRALRFGFPFRRFWLQ